MQVEAQFDQTSVRLLVHALRAEANGKDLRRDLLRGLRAAAQPAAIAVKTAILSMPSAGAHSGDGDSRSLRAAIAAGIKVHVKLSGKAKHIGVTIAAHSRGMPREFRRAPKYLNRRRPWRHPVFGNRENWVSQVSRRPGWFDGTLKAYRPAVARAADEALDNVARRISAKTRG